MTPVNLILLLAVESSVAMLTCSHTDISGICVNGECFEGSSCVPVPALNNELYCCPQSAIKETQIHSTCRAFKGLGPCILEGSDGCYEGTSCVRDTENDLLTCCLNSDIIPRPVCRVPGGIGKKCISNQTIQFGCPKGSACIFDTQSETNVCCELTDIVSADCGIKTLSITNPECTDLVLPNERTSCSKDEYKCNIPYFYDVMTKFCPRTCHRCPVTCSNFIGPCISEGDVHSCSGGSACFFSNTASGNQCCLFNDMINTNCRV